VQLMAPSTTRQPLSGHLHQHSGELRKNFDEYVELTRQHMDRKQRHLDLTQKHAAHLSGEKRRELPLDTTKPN
jgi:hypothetical protein